VYSRSHKFIFIHVPKTGGNSLQSVLLPYAEEVLVDSADGVERKEFFELRNESLGLTKHATLQEYRDGLDVEEYRSLFKFSVIRNPWDRMVSHYFSPHRSRPGWNRGEFKSMIKWVPPLRRFICRDRYSARVIDGAWRLLGKPGRRLGAEVDMLLRFEHLEEDFAAVCRRLGVPQVALPKRNASERGPYADYYDDETQALVARRFCDEIALGGYTF
jgi:hypothetical protein